MAIDKQIQKAWINDVLVWGGIVPVAKSARPQNFHYELMYGYNTRRIGEVNTSVPGYAAAKYICNFIVNRPANVAAFQQLNDMLKILVAYQFSPSLKLTDNSKYHQSVFEEYAFLFDLLAEQKFYIDDTGLSQQEHDELYKTPAGVVAHAHKCFLSQQNGQSAPQPSGQRQPPKHDYKSRGPQSKNALCLINQAQGKFKLNQSLVYCVRADKANPNGNTPNAFIKPLLAKNCPGGVANVFFGSGRDFSDCECWFTDIQTATAFKVKADAKFGHRYSNIKLYKAHPDPNGYFQARTEFGDCYIKAKPLNERLAEDGEGGNGGALNKIFDRLFAGVPAKDLSVFKKHLYK